MKNRSWSVTYFVSAVGLMTTAAVWAFPPDATQTLNRCSTCHEDPAQGGRRASGKIQLVDYLTLTDLGTQLDGRRRGPLPTFQVPQGGSVRIHFEVLDGAPTYALQVKRLEFGGQRNSGTNFLAWSAANSPTNGWDRHDDPNVPAGIVDPYFTKGPITNGVAGRYFFDLAIDARTPADYYDLEIGIGGKDNLGIWYYDRHYYLQVVSASLAVRQAVTFPVSLESQAYVLEVADEVTGPYAPYTGPKGVVGGDAVVLMPSYNEPKKFYRLSREPL